MAAGRFERAHSAVEAVLAVALSIWGIGWALENGPAIAPLVYAGCALILVWVLAPPFLRRLRRSK